MKLTFIGAAHEVTGSCTLLECCGGNFLIDYGMEQGVNVFENAPLLILPGQIDAVFLTHAHIDHSGMLPKAVQGRLPWQESTRRGRRRISAGSC
ncbi:MAG: MBL fold metallo-hydrolase [Oscillospiraceae bacterium]